MDIIRGSAPTEKSSKKGLFSTIDEDDRFVQAFVSMAKSLEIIAKKLPDKSQPHGNTSDNQPEK